jgi:hypothetical protein
MELALNSVFDVFVFIILCSGFVCSILWLYGDLATRGLAGLRGGFIVLALAIPGLIAIPVLVESPGLIAVLMWPLGFLIWLNERPEEKELGPD